jgi:NADH:ubiquinone oxidoreductase subunit
MRAMMGFWSKVFTWWNGATVGTALFTRRFGDEVGRDDAGNIYYQDKKHPGRRWVIYAGDNDGSRVPPGWQLWLKGTIDELPDKALPPVRKFQKEPTPNLTGTMAAFRPDGALGSGKLRPASTGDYEPWIPE